jgi:cell division protein FtsI/penicillin-binding protein 2
VATPTSTYYDPGYIEMGGQIMYNWDRSAPGETSMETLLARSLNVGAATIASWMGSDTFYDYLLRFGFGQPTRVDLMSEAVGALPLPGDTLWTETNLGTNAFGQGMAVTPLQMLTAVSALANDGVMMQPYLVAEVHQNDGAVFVREPAEAGRPISALTARQVTAMAVNAVRLEVPAALVDGFTIAGKTSSAQIPEGGVYDPNDIIGVFIGWLPADNPELLVLVKLDRPQSAPWGSQTAAPVFGELVRDLVVMLDIPPDTVRYDEDVSRVRGD